MYTEYEIRQIPLSVARYKAAVEAFLADNGLRLDAVDYYAGVYRIDSDDTTPTVTYFSKHSQDYLAGRLKDFKVTEDTNGTTKGQWQATYTGPLSVAANAALKDSKDLGITKANGSGAIGTKTVKLQQTSFLLQFLQHSPTMV